MDFSRAQGRLLSFAVSAMMTSAVLATAPQPGVMTAAAGPQPAQIMTMIEGARSAGFAGMKDMPAPATVAAPAPAEEKSVSAKSAPTLTPAQLLKIRNYALSPQGKVDGIRGPICAALGVGPGDRNCSFPSAGAIDDDIHIGWELWVLPDSAGYIIGRVDMQNVKTRFFVMDMNMRLVGNTSVGDSHSTPVAIPAVDAPALFAHDLAEWVPISDILN